jgi:hypothetical protein
VRFPADMIVAGARPIRVIGISCPGSVWQKESKPNILSHPQGLFQQMM